MKAIEWRNTVFFCNDRECLVWQGRHKSLPPANNLEQKNGKFGIKNNKMKQSVPVNEYLWLIPLAPYANRRPITIKPGWVSNRGAQGSGIVHFYLSKVRVNGGLRVYSASLQSVCHTKCIHYMIYVSSSRCLQNMVSPVPIGMEF